MGIYPVIEPVTNVITLRFPDVDRVAKALEARGWRVSTTRAPKALRVVIMPHVTEETIEMFLNDLECVT